MVGPARNWDLGHATPAPAGVCAGLDAHMGSGVRGAAETRRVS